MHIKYIIECFRYPKSLYFQIELSNINKIIMIENKRETQGFKKDEIKNLSKLRIIKKN